MLKTLIGISALLTAQTAVSVEVCHLANEGFLIKGEKQSVLFDALIAKPQHGYPAMKESNIAKMIHGEAPFENVAVALTSHHHTDHFQADVLAKHAKANPATAYFITDEAKADLGKVTQSKKILGRVESTTPTIDTSPIRTEFKGIEVDKYRISHGNDTENIGYKVTLDGLSFFHTGDMVATAEQLKQAEINQLEIDYLFIPFWYGLDNDKQRAAVNQAWNYKHIVLMHLEDGESKWMKPYGGREGLSTAMKKRWPNVIVPNKELECFKAEVN